MKTKTTKGWAIVDGDTALGKYWWFGTAPAGCIPEHMDGYITAVFLTRKAARRVLPFVRKLRPRARVARVEIVVRPL